MAMDGAREAQGSGRTSAWWMLCDILIPPCAKTPIASPAILPSGFV